MRQQLPLRAGALRPSAASTGTFGGAVALKSVRITRTPCTEAGDLPVGAARGLSASPDDGTTFGRIHHPLKNAGGTAVDLDIHATTAHGDITARSLRGALL
ncbi:hypothetical protein [Streptomyces sp. NPDC017991]|uniref:hypothetical protein n=1 Tax=Streptomyces sp. NPDC017991 TaxID=3365026 RepID=UPI003788F3B6